MEVLLIPPPIKQATQRGIAEGGDSDIWVNGRWVPPSYFTDEFDNLAYGGIDGEELMGTGTAFDTDEAGPVYTPAGS